MAANRVLLETSDAIATVTLNRADKHNALDLAMFQGIASTIDKIHKNRQIRAVIVTGEGSDFSSGLDVKSVMSSTSAALKLLWKWHPFKANLAQKCCIGWRKLPVPVIFALRGRCWGGGLQIALGGDFRIAHPETSLAIMESNWGLIPDMGGSTSLRELVGYQDAALWTMTAEPFSAQVAQSKGLLLSLNQDPYQEALDLAQRLCQRSPDALRAIKGLYQQAWHQNDPTLLAKETFNQLRVLVGPNRSLAVKKALGKSQEDFQRRF